MNKSHRLQEDSSIRVKAVVWPEFAAATTDGSALAVDAGPETKKTGWPEAAAFTTDVSAYVEDLRR